MNVSCEAVLEITKITNKKKLKPTCIMHKCQLIYSCYYYQC